MTRHDPTKPPCGAPSWDYTTIGRAAKALGVDREVIYGLVANRHIPGALKVPPKPGVGWKTWIPWSG